MNLLRTARKVQLLRRARGQTRDYTVCIADPRTVLNEPSAALQEAEKGLLFDVPDAFVEKLTLGTNEQHWISEHTVFDNRCSWRCVVLRRAVARGGGRPREQLDLWEEGAEMQTCTQQRTLVLQ
jgi:hypothetical protein